MARISKLVVLQSSEELKKLVKSQRKYKNIQRLQSLLYIKEQSFKTREELSQFMGVSRRTIEKWVSLYREGGLDKMLISEKRVRRSKLIPQEVNMALAQRLQDCNQGFLSYVEAQQWLACEHNLDLKYNTVREHLIRHFKTKIKSPRKSHVKKDSEAVDAFLKTT